jgi:hypothetical protein
MKAEYIVNKLLEVEEAPIEPNQAQKLSLERLKARWGRDPDEVSRLFGENEVVMVRYGNLWLGIEPDGYTHS